MDGLRIALAQLNTTVGNLSGNAEKILEYAGQAAAAGADLVAFPELALTGYPPEDLILNTDFTAANMDWLQRIASAMPDIAALVGFVDVAEDNFNAAALIGHGRVLDVYHKTFLPNYGVFDENRYFAAGRSNLVLELEGVRIGVTICEDIWFPGGPMEEVITEGGADVVVSLNASPFYRGRELERSRLVEARAVDSLAVLAYVNMVGGQDELVFDGGSMVFHPTKGMLALGARFAEDLVMCDVDVSTLRGLRAREPRQRYMRKAEAVRQVRFAQVESSRAAERPVLHPRTAPPPTSGPAEVHAALVLGLADYVRKNRFSQVVIGLSGGIDSALTAALAVEALGPKQVTCIFMPSRVTSDLSHEAAEEFARNLGVNMETYPIADLLECYRGQVAGSLEGPGSKVTLENLQARIRGNILMNISNSRGALVLATGNKSELSMGYCTLYGDMVGGFAVIKDLRKTDVYEVSRYINQVHGKDMIPVSIIEREPTAELAEGQKDTDSLPPYDILDPILEAYVEKSLGVADIVRMGFDKALVLEVAHKVDTNEYKRRQGPVGIKITPRAFGRDWRMPISKYIAYE